MYVVSNRYLRRKTNDWGEVLRLNRLFPDSKFNKISGICKEELHLNTNIEALEKPYYKVGDFICDSYVSIECFYYDNRIYTNYTQHNIELELELNPTIKVAKSGNVITTIDSRLTADINLIPLARAYTIALSAVGDFVDVELICDNMSMIHACTYGGNKSRSLYNLASKVRERSGAIAYTLTSKQFFGRVEEVRDGDK